MDGRYAVRTTVPGPWGPLHVAATDRGVVAVSWGATADAFDHGLNRRLGIPVGASTVTTDRAHGHRDRHLAAGLEALEAFLAGRPVVSPDLDLADRPPFDRRVLAAVARIPWGATVSYGDVARQVGSPGAARAVGGAVGRNPISLLIPCHRVIAADGTLGGYGGGAWDDAAANLEIKADLLLREGVTTRRRGR